MHSLEGIIAANRAAEYKQAAKKAAGDKRTKAGEVAALKFHAKQIKQDKAGRLSR